MKAVRPILILLCFLSIGCTEKKTEISKQDVTSKLYLAVECENSGNTNLKISEFFPQDAKAIPCEDVTQGRVYYSDDQLKLKFFKKDFATVKFNCLSPDKHKEFLTKQYNKDIVLVYDGVLLKSYRVNGVNPDIKCGELVSYSYEESANMCFAVADARGEPVESCTIACSETDSKICLDN